MSTTTNAASERAHYISDKISISDAINKNKVFQGTCSLDVYKGKPLTFIDSYHLICVDFLTNSVGCNTSPPASSHIFLSHLTKNYEPFRDGREILQ